MNRLLVAYDNHMPGIFETVKPPSFHLIFKLPPSDDTFDIAALATDNPAAGRCL